MRLAFRRASSCFCQSWTGIASGVAARSSQRSSTSWSFSEGLKSNTEGEAVSMTRSRERVFRNAGLSTTSTCILYGYNASCQVRQMDAPCRDARQAIDLGNSLLSHFRCMAGTCSAVYERAERKRRMPQQEPRPGAQLPQPGHRHRSGKVTRLGPPRPRCVRAQGSHGGVYPPRMQQHRQGRRTPRDRLALPQRRRGRYSSLVSSTTSHPYRSSNRRRRANRRGGRSRPPCGRH